MNGSIRNNRSNLIKYLLSSDRELNLLLNKYKKEGQRRKMSKNSFPPKKQILSL